MRYTVGTLIATLQTLDAALPVVVSPRFTEFDVTLDSAVPPDSEDGKFTLHVFIDPIEGQKA